MKIDFELSRLSDRALHVFTEAGEVNTKGNALHRVVGSLHSELIRRAQIKAGRKTETVPLDFPILTMRELENLSVDLAARIGATEVFLAASHLDGNEEQVKELGINLDLLHQMLSVVKIQHAALSGGTSAIN